MEKKNYELTSDVKRGDISTNVENLKESLRNEVEPFVGYEIEDETQVSDGKDVLSKLRKIRKMIDDEKKRVKSEYMEPYTSFEKHVKDMFGDIDKAIKEIDEQVKLYEQMRKDEKYQEIKDYYDIAGIEEVPLDLIFKTQWLNKGYKEKDWMKELDEEITRILGDFITLSEFDEANLSQLKIDYLNNGLDVEKAITRFQDRQRTTEAVEDETEYITITKSRYDELLEIEKKYKDMESVE